MTIKELASQLRDSLVNEMGFDPPTSPASPFYDDHQLIASYIICPDCGESVIPFSLALELAETCSTSDEWISFTENEATKLLSLSSPCVHPCWMEKPHSN